MLSFCCFAFVFFLSFFFLSFFVFLFFCFFVLFLFCFVLFCFVDIDLFNKEEKRNVLFYDTLKYPIVNSIKKRLKIWLYIIPICLRTT